MAQVNGNEQKVQSEDRNKVSIIKEQKWLKSFQLENFERI